MHLDAEITDARKGRTITPMFHVFPESSEGGAGGVALVNSAAVTTGPHTVHLRAPEHMARVVSHLVDLPVFQLLLALMGLCEQGAKSVCKLWNRAVIRRYTIAPAGRFRESVVAIQRCLRSLAGAGLRWPHQVERAAQIPPPFLVHPFRPARIRTRFQIGERVEDAAVRALQAWVGGSRLAAHRLLLSFTGGGDGIGLQRVVVLIHPRGILSMRH